MEFLRVGDDGADNVDVLRGFLQPVQPSGKGPGNHTEIRNGRTDTVGTFYIERMDNKTKGANHGRMCLGLLSVTS